MTYGIALGSNLGDRTGHLREAVRQLQNCCPDLQIEGASPIYETAPVDCPEDAPGFLNAVVVVATETPPLELLGVLREIEQAMGRPREHEHHAPRTVDLDLLFADQITLDHPDLILPHPRMTGRRFVLQPLADVQPHRLLPGQHLTVQELLDELVSNEPPPRRVSQTWLP
jgi:2-amino-4-hydroxy-6-hydroxymethyldihydropteridine diphosphokinase